MTRKLIAILILLFPSIIKLSAQVMLPMDTLGHVTFYDIVEAEGFKKETLYQNAIDWLNERKDFENNVKITTEDIAGGKIEATNEFPVYSQTGVLKKISGKITYTIGVDLKDGRYRYTITNFVFHYYKQDRNYKYVSTGKTKKLEDMKASGWQKLWNKHKVNTAAKIQTDIDKLKAKMVFVAVDPAKEAEKKAVKKWDN